MRELKFRAYLKKEKKYVFPTMILVDFGIVTGIAYIDIDEITHQPIERRLIIEDVVLEQATGIKDKNRKMIYEGDIVKMRYPYDKRCVGKFVVVKDSNSPRIGLLDKTKTDEIFDLYNHMSNHYEVIGNIHDNPELLEENKSA
jgi:hypothetical protein|nr:MAG TPA: YopX protein [Caudoviricetes sp.]